MLLRRAEDNKSDQGLRVLRLSRSWPPGYWQWLPRAPLWRPTFTTRPSPQLLADLLRLSTVTIASSPISFRNLVSPQSLVLTHGSCSHEGDRYVLPTRSSLRRAVVLWSSCICPDGHPRRPTSARSRRHGRSRTRTRICLGRRIPALDWLWVRVGSGPVGSSTTCRRHLGATPVCPHRKHLGVP